MDEYHVAPDDAHQMFLDTVRRCFVWATLIAVVVAGVVGYAATRTVLSPLRRMTDVARAFAGGGHSRRRRVRVLRGPVMDSNELSRRQFAKLTAAAVGGLMAGVNTTLAEDKKPEHKDPKKDGFPWLQDPHVCRGLNHHCKEEVKGKKNECAGQANFPTVKEHTCKGMNECAGEGGCGEKPGENMCKGKGECAVPLMDKPWAIAPKNFEAAMKKADKKFGDAPAKPKKGPRFPHARRRTVTGSRGGRRTRPPGRRSDGPHRP